MALKTRPFFLAVTIGLLLASSPAKAMATAQSSPREATAQAATLQQTADQGESTQSEDSAQPPVESPLVPEPPPLTPAQRFQSEIFVLRSQAEGFIAQAEAREEISPELQALIVESQAVVAATTQVNTLFDVSRLEVLRDQLLDAPLRLYQATTATPEPGPSLPPEVTPRARPRPGPPGTASPLRPTQQIPPELRHGAQAYFGGDYKLAIDALSKASFPAPRSQALALLLRAAARYSLFLTAEEQDESQLAVVRAEIRECMRLAPRLRPDPNLYSPRFVRFFGHLSGARRPGP